MAVISIFLSVRLMQPLAMKRPVSSAPRDPLADVLDLSRVRGVLMANVRAHAPWGIELPQNTGASFHAVTSGTAWLRVDGQDPLQLMPGDLSCSRPGSRTSSRPRRARDAGRSTAP
jgi:hypothetical protein